MLEFEEDRCVIMFVADVALFSKILLSDHLLRTTRLSLGEHTLNP